MDFSTNQISFLRDVHSSIKIDMISGWRYHQFDTFSVYEKSDFIKQIGDNKIYLLIPLFSTSKSLDKPTLNLSEPFLVDNKSNPGLITQFIYDQWLGSGFGLRDASIIFKFKRVWYSYK